MAIFDNQYKLKGIIIGLRYGPLFSIESKLGEIIDGIIYDQNLIFGNDYFSSVLGVGNERELINEKTKNKIRLSHQDIILFYNIADTEKESSIHQIIDGYQNLLSGVLKNAGLNKILRIGHISQYEVLSPEITTSYLASMAEKAIDGTDEFWVRFVKKLKTPQKKGINDYDNVIQTIMHPENKNILKIEIDYQTYFIPPLESTLQLKFKEFITSVKNYNENQFNEWLNKYNGRTND
ncbi:MAG: hypothetical protein JXA06_12260 [Bacteroidetes bacterium]|nr:hypothetical protein [Bacteroidota bacterium]